MALGLGSGGVSAGRSPPSVGINTEGAVMTVDPRAMAGRDGPLGRSCMKWGSDGELSALDLQSILQRLSEVDEQASTLMDCPLDLAG